MQVNMLGLVYSLKSMNMGEMGESLKLTIQSLLQVFYLKEANWAALAKEAFAIYSFIKKLSYYLKDAEIILRSDHLPLKKFLQKNTLNTKVSNWW